VADDEDDEDGAPVAGFFATLGLILRSARNFIPEDNSVLSSVKSISTERFTCCCTLMSPYFRNFFARKMSKLYTALRSCGEERYFFCLS